MSEPANEHATSDYFTVWLHDKTTKKRIEDAMVYGACLGNMRRFYQKEGYLQEPTEEQEIEFFRSFSKTDPDHEFLAVHKTTGHRSIFVDGTRKEI